jgi:Uma2 family endonuclease
MSGATLAHNQICGNFYALLHAHLSGTGCRAYINDVKLCIEALNSFYYPDIMVTCEPFVPKNVYAKAPVLVAEVMSPSTKHIDRREKLLAYRQLMSLGSYLIIHQDRYCIEIYREDSAGNWDVDILGKCDALSLDRIGVGKLKVPVAAIYGDIVLEPTVEEEEEDYAFHPHSQCD